jgi:enoyl reductase-like protein
MDMNSSAINFFIDLIKSQANKNLNPEDTTFALAFGSKLQKVVNFVDVIDVLHEHSCSSEP